METDAAPDPDDVALPVLDEVALKVVAEEGEADPVEMETPIHWLWRSCWHGGCYEDEVEVENRCGRRWRPCPPGRGRGATTSCWLRRWTTGTRKQTPKRWCGCCGWDDMVAVEEPVAELVLVADARAVALPVAVEDADGDPLGVADCEEQARSRRTCHFEQSVGDGVPLPEKADEPEEVPLGVPCPR
jgi:hypothetical protein